MAEETVPMDDKELFNSALADDPPKDTPKAEHEPVKAEEPVRAEEPGERARDEKGRFLPQQTEEPAVKAAPSPQAVQPAAQAETPKEADPAMVPSWRLREINEQRQADAKRAEEAERRFYELQAQLQATQNQLQQLSKPKQEPVDVFADPNAWFQQNVDPIQQAVEQRLSALSLNMSKRLAVMQHGQDKVTEMENYLQQAISRGDPDMAGLSQRMRASEDPVGTAFEWYRTKQTYEKTGGDLDKYVEAQIEARLKDPGYQKTLIDKIRGNVTPGANPITELPPSLNKAGGASNQTLNDDDVSDRALFNYAMRGR